MFQTTNNLEFLVKPFEWAFLDNTYHLKCFRVGTCHGVFGYDNSSYVILAVHNEHKGNGHFDDTLQWFAYSCVRDGKNLRIIELENDKLRDHLIKKRSFKSTGNNSVEIESAKLWAVVLGQSGSNSK